TSRVLRRFGQKNGVRIAPRTIGMAFQLLSSCPHVVHFFRNRTVVPSWPTITAPFPATALARPAGVAQRASAGGTVGGGSAGNGGSSTGAASEESAVSGSNTAGANSPCTRLAAT